MQTCHLPGRCCARVGAISGRARWRRFWRLLLHTHLQMDYRNHFGSSQPTLKTNFRWGFLIERWLSEQKPTAWFSLERGIHSTFHIVKTFSSSWSPGIVHSGQYRCSLHPRTVVECWLRVDEYFFTTVKNISKNQFCVKVVWTFTDDLARILRHRPENPVILRVSWIRDDFSKKTQFSAWNSRKRVFSELESDWSSRNIEIFTTLKFNRVMFRAEFCLMVWILHEVEIELSRRCGEPGWSLWWLLVRGLASRSPRSSFQESPQPSHRERWQKST